MNAYHYNSFELMRQRLTEVDMLNLADLILGLPLQIDIEVEGKKYLFAHAMTSYVGVPQKRDYYLMGNSELDASFLEGVEGYISMCGHTPTDNVIWKTGNHTYLDEYKNSIWRNEKENVYLLDCGSGFKSGRLACLCIETGERYYSE